LGGKSQGRGRVLVKLNFTPYPLQSSLGVLGRKWGLLVFMNIAFGRAKRFNELRRLTPGMSKRILAIRLKELEASGFLTRSEMGRGHANWLITPKGADVLPVLLTLIHFGSKWREGGSPLNSDDGRTFEISFTR
jgi:DNA-binding HxlR family transcriptional regulator